VKDEREKNKMKKLTGLDEKILNLEDGNVPEEALPSFRTLIKVMLNKQVAKNADESIDVNQILLKLRMVEPDIEFENAEFKLIKDKVGENQAKMFQGPHGQILAYLDRCDKASEKKPGLEVK
jgi:hypothetical protein